MTSPAPQPAAQQQTPAGQVAQQPTGQQAAAPDQQQSPAATPQAATSQPQQPRTSSSPARLRLARGIATAAAALTGIVATGTFGTGGVNPTPNVIASQWVSAEQAGVHLAEADLATARALVAVREGQEPDREAISTALSDAAEELALAGSEEQHAAGAREIVTAGVLAERAISQARTDGDAAADTFAASSTAARSAASASGAVADTSAEALHTGSRSSLTAIIGGLATVVMLGVMVWLALLTRRILNIPLLIATAITGWLTYLSLNPGAMPLNYEDRVEEFSQAATAREEVLQARAAQYAVALGVGDQLTTDLETELEQAAQAVDDLGREQASAWESATEGIDTLVQTEGTSARLQLIKDTESAFQALDDDLHGVLVGRLEGAEQGVGTTASITAGAALLLGLMAAGLAWTGITRRLRDYR